MFLPTKVKLLPTYGTRYSSLHHSHNITYPPPLPRSTLTLLKLLKKGETSSPAILVSSGSQSAFVQGQPTLLGRGGS